MELPSIAAGPVLTPLRSVSKTEQVELVRNGRAGRLKQVWIALPSPAARLKPRSLHPN